MLGADMRDSGRLIWIGPHGDGSWGSGAEQASLQGQLCRSKHSKALGISRPLFISQQARVELVHNLVMRGKPDACWIPTCAFSRMLAVASVQKIDVPCDRLMGYADFVLQLFAAVGRSFIRHHPVSGWHWPLCICQHCDCSPAGFARLLILQSTSICQINSKCSQVMEWLLDVWTARQLSHLWPEGLAVSFSLVPFVGSASRKKVI